MNKYKILIQKIIRQAIVSAVVIAVAVGAYIGVTMFEESVVADQKKAEEKLNKDKSLLTSYTSQMDKSGDAEKRFEMLIEKRAEGQLDFSGTREAFRNWLMAAKDRVRITIDPKSTLCDEKISDKAELGTLQGYSIYVCSGTSLSVSAVTDLHVFSFIEEMRRSAPTLVRIDGIELKRNSEMTDNMIDGFRKGTTPPLVSGKVDFSTISIRAKEDKKTDKAGAPAEAGK